ncbi:hypothetical protein [Micromonospora rubida]
MAARAQWPEPVVGVGVGDALGDEVAAADRVVVGDGGPGGAEPARGVVAEVVGAAPGPA